MVIKVHIASQCCKRKLLQAVSVLQGIDKIEMDAEKNTMTVIGSADPMDVIKRIRKVCKCAEISTIGPPAKPEPEPSKPASCPSYPPICFSECPSNPIVCVPPRYVVCREEPPQFCTFM
ncbi:heavy metal-associated isoprenylated plant protein 2-like [Asparagus officinalis]|uniref:heavy metal-associated isoprenylated plant protein 2-like n=1 Tax=Asparagus officinalis TaxID=4686 RepID=UPI00098E35AB|nr:heavy metal-associated isoprenylated plant protein 2-like [Asparagus officinalis]